jgi:hypothetical protein
MTSPLSGRTITGQIDFVQVRNGAIHILDDKLRIPVMADRHSI